MKLARPFNKELVRLDMDVIQSDENRPPDLFVWDKSQPATEQVLARVGLHSQLGLLGLLHVFVRT